MKRHIAATLVILGIALTLSACPGNSGGHHPPPPTVIIHKP